MSTLDSILSAMNVMDGILGREQKFVIINGKKEVWPMGNCDEIFRAIGRTIHESDATVKTRITMDRHM